MTHAHIALFTVLFNSAQEKHGTLVKLVTQLCLAKIVRTNIFTFFSLTVILYHPVNEEYIFMAVLHVNWSALFLTIFYINNNKDVHLILNSIN